MLKPQTLALNLERAYFIGLSRITSLQGDILRFACACFSMSTLQSMSRSVVMLTHHRVEGASVWHQRQCNPHIHPPHLPSTPFAHGIIPCLATRYGYSKTQRNNSTATRSQLGRADIPSRLDRIVGRFSSLKEAVQCVLW